MVRYAAPNVSTKPRINPPIIAPGILPIPPKIAAVKAFVATDTKGFPPSVGQIKQRLVQLKMPDMPDEAEAWKQVWVAIQSSAYHSKEEFEKLHPIVQRVVGQPEMLKAWAMEKADDIQTVIASNFQVLK